MILTRKRLLVDIFLTRSLSKSLAFCEFASVNFQPCQKSNLDQGIDDFFCSSSFVIRVNLPHMLLPQCFCSLTNC